MPQMTARVTMTYAGRARSPGESFEVDQKYSAILQTLGRAYLSQGGIDAGTYGTRDMQATRRSRRKYKSTPKAD